MSCNICPASPFLGLSHVSWWSVWQKKNKKQHHQPMVCNGAEIWHHVAYVSSTYSCLWLGSCMQMPLPVKLSLKRVATILLLDHSINWSSSLQSFILRPRHSHTLLYYTASIMGFSTPANSDFNISAGPPPPDKQHTSPQSSHLHEV